MTMGIVAVASLAVGAAVRNIATVSQITIFLFIGLAPVSLLPSQVWVVVAKAFCLFHHPPRTVKRFQAVEPFKPFKWFKS
jgi:hypothetical protein